MYVCTYTPHTLYTHVGTYNNNALMEHSKDTCSHVAGGAATDSRERCQSRCLAKWMQPVKDNIPYIRMYV